MEEKKNIQQKLFLVDDHQIVIDGLNTMLKRNKDYNVVGEALNGKEGIDFIEKHEIDILITDINMPEMSGTDLTRIVKEKYPHVKVLILSMYNDREIIHDIIMSEAEGYILKNTGKEELLNALEKITNGGTFYSNEVMKIITSNYVAKEKAHKNTKDLTPRELEILKLVCQEYSTPEIAEQLFISPLTVETHRKNILKKTNNKTIIGLIKFAIENGIT